MNKRLLHSNQLKRFVSKNCSSRPLTEHPSPSKRAKGFWLSLLPKDFNIWQAIVNRSSLLFTIAGVLIVTNVYVTHSKNEIAFEELQKENENLKLERSKAQELIMTDKFISDLLNESTNNKMNITAEDKYKYFLLDHLFPESESLKRRIGIESINSKLAMDDSTKPKLI